MKFNELYKDKIKKVFVGDKVRIKRIRINPNSSEEQVVSENERYVGEVATIKKIYGGENGFDYRVKIKRGRFGVLEEDIEVVY